MKKIFLFFLILPFFLFCEVMAKIDKYKKGEQKYFDALKKIEYLRKDKPRFDYERGAISAIYVVNEVMPVLKKFFQDNRKDEGNKVLRLMFEYITSRTPLSGKFVIAK